MQIPEHTNCSRDMAHFIEKYSHSVDILENEQIDFDYPDKKFNRFMLFGIKK